MSLEPAFVDKQTVYNASSILATATLSGCLDDLLRYNSAVSTGDEGFFELAWDAFADKITKAERYLGDFFGGDGRWESFVVVGWKDWRWLDGCV